MEADNPDCDAAACRPPCLLLEWEPGTSGWLALAPRLSAEIEGGRFELAMAGRQKLDVAVEFDAA